MGQPYVCSYGGHNEGINQFAWREESRRLSAALFARLLITNFRTIDSFLYKTRAGFQVKSCILDVDV